MTGVQRRTWRPGFAVDVRGTLAVFGRRGYDPAQRIGPDGAVWRAVRTPDGPATMRVAAPGGGVDLAAWGPGAAWALAALPAWLGAEDRPSEFRPQHPLLERALKQNPGLRIGRSGLIMDALVPAILEQKVTGREASRSWRSLLMRHGEPAPGPAPEPAAADAPSRSAPAELRVMPAPEALRMLPSWEWHRLGVGPQRAETIVRAARVARRLEEAAAMAPDDAATRLQAVPGIGPWTAAEVIQRALGDPDTVSVGDFGLPGLVSYTLTGERTADDARMLELLEPYRGQRYRACLLIERAGVKRPRRGPRQPIRDFRRM
jgi:3-methyladenine DNA glycosylase/8-oxoguanine DNA glycosylase